MNGHGFTVRSAAGQVSISSETYNLIYAGRAALVKSGYAIGAAWPERYDIHGITTPLLRYYDFAIEVSASTAVVPFFSCPGYCGIAFVRQASATRWEMELFATAQPTVYCFTRIPPGTPVNGHGLAVFRSDGGVAYLSTQPHIIPRAVAPVASHASSIASYGRGSTFAYAPTQAAYPNAIGVPGLSAPILHYATNNSAARNYSDGITQYLFMRVAQISGGNVNVIWGLSATVTSLGNGINYDAPGDSNLAIVAEGAYFG